MLFSVNIAHRILLCGALMCNLRC